MPLTSDSRLGASAETLLGKVARRVRRIAFWDSVLLFVPPTAAIVYLLFALGDLAIIDRNAVISAGLAAIALGGFLIVRRYRPRVPDLRQTAQWVDQRVEAKDRFLTLSTIEPQRQPPGFIARLRAESETYGRRIQLTQDFPYRFKFSVVASLVVSLVAAVMIHFFLAKGFSAIRPVSVAENLRLVAEKMIAHSELASIAADLRELARKVEDPKIPPVEKQTAAKEVQEKIEQRQQEKPPPKESELLGEASSAVAGVEKQQSSSGQGEQDQQNKGGGIQSNAPQDGEGEGKQGQGGSGDNQGKNKTAESSRDMEQGKSAQGDPKQKGQEANRQAKGTAQGESPDPNKPGEQKGQDPKGKNQAQSKEGAGKNRAAEGPPQGPPPTDRLAKPGEQAGGLKGAGYVTVQLPEEVISDTDGKSRQSKDSTGRKSQANVPVANIPLPAHIPNAPTEKQQVPLEYRGIIR